MNKMTPEELEKFIHRELRGLPVRHAPSTLEGRVLAAIEQRASIPWYHKSWSYWPAAVRAVFLAAITGLAGSAIAAFYLFMQGAQAGVLSTQVSRWFELLTLLYAGVVWTVNFISQTITSIPPLWLYGGAVVIGALYVTFFGLGATAYRVLYRNHE